MTWGNAAALLGLLLLALPIAIHLLARRSARVLRFPTLRFLVLTRLIPRRSPRLTDPILLAIRLGVVAAAVLALAQPALSTHVRGRGSQTLTRVFVLDTSASMQRRTSTGERALDVGRRAVQPLLSGTVSTLTIETVAPAQTIDGAVAWLNTKATMREIVIVSDFQAGTIDSLSLASVPGDIGIRLLPVAFALAEGTGTSSTRQATVESVARISATPAGTTVDWELRPAEQVAERVQLLAGAAEQRAVRAAEQAAASLSMPTTYDSTRAITIVYPQYPQRAELMARARLPRQRWMADALARVHDDAVLASAAAQAEQLPLPGVNDSTFTVVARTSRDSAVVIGAAVDSQLLLFPLVDAGSLTAAALIAAARRATAIAPPLGELEPVLLPREELERWQRPPGQPRAPSGRNNNSDGRWFWLAALVLLIVETVVRRRPQHAATAVERASVQLPMESNERVA